MLPSIAYSLFESSLTVDRAGRAHRIERTRCADCSKEIDHTLNLLAP